MKQLLILICVALFQSYSFAQNNNLAPGAPGKDAQWESAGKTGVGTSTTLESKVWFTLHGGVMTEVYYPTVDVANVRLLQFIVVDSRGKVETERDDAVHETTAVEGLTFRQTNKAKSGAWEIVKTYVTDVERSTVLIDVSFKESKAGEHRLYVYYDSSLNNSGMHDSAWTQDGALLASDADKASALVSSIGFAQTTNGYFGTESDGLIELRKSTRKITEQYNGPFDVIRTVQSGTLASTYIRAANGNAVQVSELKLEPKTSSVTLAIGFGKDPDEALNNARASITKTFVKARDEYQNGWREYVKTLRRVDAKYQRQFEMAAMVLKAHEDKSYRGANIASLSVPWGGGSNANEPNVGGYHLVWSRDLYQVATAYMALGDKAAADRALQYLFKVQQKADGGFPQNSWLDGRPFWGSLQLDEVAFPLILAYQLGRTDNETYTKHVKPAADFIIKNGAYTPQERWEEEAGYSPSTIAAQVAGLVCAADIARKNNDEANAKVYEAKADEWARDVEKWTATTTGFYGDKNYYLRITENNNPNDGAMLELNNGAGAFDERRIVDAGFLELVRLGIKPANDALIAKSIKVVDEVLKVETPNGAAFYRYNNDGYGEMDDGRNWNFDGKYTGKGRLWALLAGERGQYELAIAHSLRSDSTVGSRIARNELSFSHRIKAMKCLDAMLGFANEGLMIPEQVWDKPQPLPNDFKFGEGTGSATPLAWSMAQFIRLAANLQEGRNMDTPNIVYERYVKRHEITGSAFTGSADILSADCCQQSNKVSLHASLKKQDALNNLALSYTLPVSDASFSRSRFTALRFHAQADEPSALQSVTSALQSKGEKSSIEVRLKQAKESPLVDGGDVYFVFRDEAKTRGKEVELIGDMTGWRSRGMKFERVADCDVRFYKTSFPPDARVEYKFSVGGEAVLDKLNAKRIDNGVGGENSVLEMPEYRGEIKTAFHHPLSNVANSLEFESKILKDKRKLLIYLPREYQQQTDKRFPVLYVQDGSDYARRALAALIAPSVVNENQFEPFIIIFVDPNNRMKEYWANDVYADFMVKELVPMIDAKYRTIANRDGRALLGASLGGVQSVWTFLKYPDFFSRVGGQSSSFWIDNGRVVNELAKFDFNKHPARFYLDAGTFGDGAETSNLVADNLKARGVRVTYKQTNAGHNWTAWRDRLADAFVELMGK